jgi:hypothetical protein
MSRYALMALTLLIVCGAMAAEAAVQVSPVVSSHTIVRQTPTGDERLVYIALTNDTGAPLRSARLTVQTSSFQVDRPLIDVPVGGAWDTLWVPDSAPSVVPARLLVNGSTLWSGDLNTTGGPTRVVIPRSPLVQASQLGLLTLRGTNYLPRSHPWPGLWRETTDAEFSAEFSEMKALHINSFRTFFFFDEEAGLVRRDGTFTPQLLARIHSLLAIAHAQGLRVMICLVGHQPYLTELDTWRRYFRTAIEPFIHDGRLLMWDLVNEPGGGDGPRATAAMETWVKTLWGELNQLDPYHLKTVGVAYHLGDLWAMGVRPWVAQYHEYSGAVGVQPPDQPPVRTIQGNLHDALVTVGPRALVVGEYGYGTQPDAAHPNASEQRQQEIHEHVRDGINALRITGAFNWTMFHFVPTWMGAFEQSFGVVRTDGSRKPAGDVLRAAYARWRQQSIAPWETPLVPASPGFGQGYMSPVTDWGWAPNGRAWVDVNGDRRADYCRRVGNQSNTDSKVACTLAGIKGFDATYTSPVLDWGYDDNTQAWVDFNADGRADYCRIVGWNGFNLQCTVSTGTGFGSTYTSGPIERGVANGRAWVDFNGDGRADYCRGLGTTANVDSKVACTVSTPTGFGATYVSEVLDWGYDDNSRAWVDFNADGKADYCRIVGWNGFNLQCTVSTGTGFGGIYTSGPIDPGAVEGRAWVDYNGDGRRDYCRVTGGSAFVDSKVACTVSTTSGFGATYASGVLDWGYASSRTWADVNADRRADFCRAVGGAPHVSRRMDCVFSAGTGFAGGYLSEVIDLGYDDSRRFVDFDADGKLDMCRVIGNEKHFDSALHCTVIVP